MKTSLTNDRVYGLFIAMHNGMSPEEMNRYAEKLEELARSFRATAKQFSELLSIQPMPANFTAPGYVQNPPTVLGAAERILKQAARPMHLAELFDAIRATGAYVDTKGNLSSMLSKDLRTTFQPVTGRRGFWELVPTIPPISNLSTHHNAGA